MNLQLSCWLIGTVFSTNLINIFSYMWKWFTLVPYLARDPRPDINNGPGMTRIVHTFWAQNDGPSPGHSNLGSDGRYTCSSLPLMVWWVPYLNKGHRPDFNNGLGGDSNSGPILAPWRLFESDLNNGPSPSHSNLVSDEVYICSGLLFMVSWLLPYWPRASRLTSIMTQEMTQILAAF